MVDLYKLIVSPYLPFDARKALCATVWGEVETRLEGSTIYIKIRCTLFPDIITGKVWYVEISTDKIYTEPYEKYFFTYRGALKYFNKLVKELNAEITRKPPEKPPEICIKHSITW